MQKNLNYYNDIDLIPGKWYYNSSRREECQYFMFMQHNYTRETDPYDARLILAKIKNITRHHNSIYYCDYTFTHNGTHNGTINECYFTAPANRVYYNNRWGRIKPLTDNDKLELL